MDNISLCVVVSSFCWIWSAKWQKWVINWMAWNRPSGRSVALRPNLLGLAQPFDPLLCPLGHQLAKRLLGGSSAFGCGWSRQRLPGDPVILANGVNHATHVNKTRGLTLSLDSQYLLVTTKQLHRISKQYFNVRNKPRQQPSWQKAERSEELLARYKGMLDLKTDNKCERSELCWRLKAAHIQINTTKKNNYTYN